MKKILAISTIRSDYDLLSHLYKLLHNDKEIDFRMLVGGAHLSNTYGRSVSCIENDGFNILLRIETLLDSDSKQSRLKSASLLLQNSIDIVAQFNPDLIIYAGDREDTIIGALLGCYLQIPTAHFFGGDHANVGHVDNPIRHSVSKLSTFHFVTIEQHKKRLLKIGELENRIFVIGSPSLDKFFNHKLIAKNKIKEIFNIDEGFEGFALIIFHPVDESLLQSQIAFENILSVLKTKKINAFVSYPNTDAGNRKIIEIIKKYENEKSFIFYTNLDRDLFLSIFKQSSLIIGNSSAGIVESASIPIPSIIVGPRQKDRAANENVVFCGSTTKEIDEALSIVSSNSFNEKIKKIKNLYGDGKSSVRAYEIIKNLDFQKFLFKKEDVLNYE